jgi:hypothetical protein
MSSRVLLISFTTENARSCSAEYDQAAEANKRLSKEGQRFDRYRSEFLTRPFRASIAVGVTDLIDEASR